MFASLFTIFFFKQQCCACDPGLADRHFHHFCVKCTFVAALSPRGERDIGEVKHGHKEVVCQRLSAGPTQTCRHQFAHVVWVTTRRFHYAVGPA